MYINRLGLFISIILLASCSTSTEDRGHYRYTVVCRNEVEDCYQRSRDLCPDGYLISNRVRGRKISDTEVEYRVVIQCKQKRTAP